jgi:hypothetical protein
MVVTIIVVLSVITEMPVASEVYKYPLSIHLDFDLRCGFVPEKAGINQEDINGLGMG